MKVCNPVAITGMGCICAAGKNLQESMKAMFLGKGESAPPTLFSSDHRVKYPVFEAPLDVATDSPVFRTSALGLVAAREALDDAGWDLDALRRLRVGVCMGTTVGCAMNDVAFYRQYRSGKNQNMATIDRFFRSNPAAVIAREFCAKGICQTVVNACSSGTDSIGMGASWIREGLCDVVIAGGADELCRVTYNGFISLMIYDETRVKPFDRNRKGLNLGEGAAIVILESEEIRSRRKIGARGFVLGYGAACDAYHLTAPRPDGVGLRQAIADALVNSGKSAGEMAFVNAHGTGTPDNDKVESRVLQEILPGTPFLSTKGFIGHTLGAAGAIEAVFTAASLEEGRLPANAGFSEPDPELGVTPVYSICSVKGNVALSESLAFGGNNSVLVIGKGEK